MSMLSAAPCPLVVESSTALPLVHCSISVVPGSIADPPEKAGLTRMTTRLMRRTAGGREPENLEAEVESLGASLGADVTHGSMSLFGVTIRRSLDAFLPILEEALTRPRFTSDEFERLRRESLSEIVEARDDDRSLARHWFRRRMYTGHAYSTPVSGTLASLAKLTLDDAERCFEQLTHRDGLVLGFAGDIDEERARSSAHRLTSALRAGARLAEEVGEPAGPKGRHLVLVDKPERTQTQILMGGLGTHPWDEDHHALILANTIFGGTFTARLTQEVRSKRGWSYGASSSLPQDRHRRAFSMWTFPKADDAGPCIRLKLDLLKAWREQGITTEELDWAKRYMVRSHAFSVDTPSKRLGLELDEPLVGLPPGYWKGYLDRIQSITLEQANAAVQNRISTTDLLTVVVGTAKDVRSSVESAIDGLEGVEVIPYEADE